MTSPTAGLDDVVHQRHRLAILTVAGEAHRVEFGYLRETLDLTAGNLSRHLTVLQEAGHISITKRFQGNRPKTWIRLTKTGHAALAGEIETLEALVRRHRASDQARSDDRDAGDEGPCEIIGTAE